MGRQLTPVTLDNAVADGQSPHPWAVAELISHEELKVPHGFALTHQDQLNEDLLGFVKSL